MELFAYLRVLTRRWWLIALLVVVGTVVATVLSLRQPPRYRTSTVLLLNPAIQSELINPGASISGLQAQYEWGIEDRLARSYDRYLKTNAFTSLAVERLGLQGVVSPEALSGAISTSRVPDTNFFNLTITWGTRQQAQALANGVARIFIEENRKLQQASRPASASAASLSDSLAYYERRVNALRLEREELENVSRLPDRRERLLDVEARLVATEDTYVKLLSSAAQARAIEEGRLNTATIVDEAPLPGGPINANLTLSVALAIAASLALGAGLAIVLEYLDDTIKTAEDLERVTGQGPLGVVTVLPGADDTRAQESPIAGLTHNLFPRPGRREMRAGAPADENSSRGDGAAAVVALPGGPAVAGQLITLHQPQHPIAEGFRMLRTNLEFSTLTVTAASGDLSPRVPASTRPDARSPAAVATATAPAAGRRLVVTSAMPQEGKTTIACNVAVVFAQAGKRVLLVDADLRNPSVHRLFGLPSQHGFTTLLINRSLDPLGEAPAPVPELPTLHVLPCGPLPPNPSELLGSPRAAELLAELAAHYDLVLFDTPPAGIVTDAAVLAARCDGVVLVAWAGRTRRGTLTACFQSLANVGARPLGTVLNKVKPQALGGYGGYNYRYYQYGSGSASASNGFRLFGRRPSPNGRYTAARGSATEAQRETAKEI